ncbi:MAG: phospholipase D-like domain-containing protein [Anaerolineales bacterium]
MPRRTISCRRATSTLVMLLVILFLLYFLPMVERWADTTSTPPEITSPTAPVLSPSTGLRTIPLRIGYGVGDTWFELYFTDPLNPLAKEKEGGPDLPLAKAIDNARLSVDAALYSLSLNSVRDALLRAHQRGVRVRMVMESENMDRADPEYLKENGIPILGDRRDGLMHNKFIVIDGQEVWTGSMNLTDSGAYSDNNNLIRIRSKEVAADYAKEFEEMFVQDKFGRDRMAETPFRKVTMPDGTKVEVYFSPDDGVAAAILPLLQRAQVSIYFLAYSFTANDLGEAILAQHKAGVEVHGVMESDQVASNRGTEFDPFRQAGIDVRLDGNPGQMHHKVIVIDRSIVILGSYNFSANAEKQNDENLLVIYNPLIAEEFIKEFERVYAVAKP